MKQPKLGKTKDYKQDEFTISMGTMNFKDNKSMYSTISTWFTINDKEKENTTLSKHVRRHLGLILFHRLASKYKIKMVDIIIPQTYEFNYKGYVSFEYTLVFNENEDFFSMCEQYKKINDEFINLLKNLSWVSFYSNRKEMVSLVC